MDLTKKSKNTLTIAFPKHAARAFSLLVFVASAAAFMVTILSRIHVHHTVRVLCNN